MPNRRGLYRAGGFGFIAGGLLFLARSLFDFAAGPPPAFGSDILAWVEAEKLFLQFSCEILFFATVSLVPAVVALYDSLGGVTRAKTVIGCGIFAITVPVLAVLLIVQGRLVYPVYGIGIDTPKVAEFAVAIYYGGTHSVGLLLAIATFVLSLEMRHSAYGNGAVFLGMATVAADVAGSYPYLIGPQLTLVCQGLFAAWLALLGWRLCGWNRVSDASH